MSVEGLRDHADAKPQHGEWSESRFAQNVASKDRDTLGDPVRLLGGR